jgi:hypothetical protein
MESHHEAGDTSIGGISAFGGGPLWTDVVIEVRNGRIDDLYWGENKALLFKPGESIKVWGEVLKELNRRYNRQAGMPRELPAWL